MFRLQPSCILTGTLLVALPTEAWQSCRPGQDPPEHAQQPRQQCQRAAALLWRQQQDVQGQQLEQESKMGQPQQQQQQQCAVSMLQQLHQQHCLAWPRMLAHLQQQSHRHLSTSGAACSKRSAWPSQQAVLHQPTKHVSGTDPLRTLKASGAEQPPSSTAGGSAAQQHAAAAQVPDSSSSSSNRPSLAARLSAGLSRAGKQVQQALEVLRPLGTLAAWGTLCLSVPYCVFLVYVQVLLPASLGDLRSPDAALQIKALRQLRPFRPVPLSPHLSDGLNAAVLDQVVARGMLQQLVALVKPGTDAAVLNELFAVAAELAQQPGIKEALTKAGFYFVVAAGLKDGWMPRGAAAAANAVLAPPPGPRLGTTRRVLGPAAASASAAGGRCIGDVSVTSVS